MIVEDDLQQRECLYLLMGYYNYWCKFCQSAEDAERAIKSGSMPDALVTDYYLHAMDGMELIRAVRGLTGGEHPVCVLMTAGGPPAVETMREELTKLRIRVIYKPYEPKNLMEAIRSALIEEQGTK